MTAACGDAISGAGPSDAISMSQDTETPVEATPFDDIEAEIEALQARLDAYHQAMVLARVAIWVGGIALGLVLTVAGGFRTPPVVFGAITAVLGGTVWFGATSSSRAEVENEMADAEARKARLFDAVAARNGWVDMTPTVH